MYESGYCYWVEVKDEAEGRNGRKGYFEGLLKVRNEMREREDCPRIGGVRIQRSECKIIVGKKLGAHLRGRKVGRLQD